MDFYRRSNDAPRPLAPPGNVEAIAIEKIAAHDLPPIEGPRGKGCASWAAIARQIARSGYFPFAFSPNSTGCRSFLVAALLSVPACSLAELVSRLSAALMNVHDLPAAIRPRSRSSSSNVQRILGITQSFLCLQPEFDQAADGFGAAGQIFLLAAPIVELLRHIWLHPHANQVPGHRRALFWCFHVNMS